MTALMAAAVLAAGGVGVGNALLGSGGTSTDPAARVGPLTADPTAPAPRFRYSYPGADAQRVLPPLGSAAGMTPSDTAPAAGTGYAPKGQPRAPFTSIPTAAATAPATTWQLFLSGGDVLQPNQGAATLTDQSIGPSLGNVCGPGRAGRWTIPGTATFPLHGPVTGLLHVLSSGSSTLTISLTTSRLGGSCTVQASTSVPAAGEQTVPFALRRVDLDLAEGSDLSPVVATSTSARITSSTQALSYVVLPMPAS